MLALLSLTLDNDQLKSSSHSNDNLRQSICGTRVVRLDTSVHTSAQCTCLPVRYRTTDIATDIIAQMPTTCPPSPVLGYGVLIGLGHWEFSSIMCILE